MALATITKSFSAEQVGKHWHLVDAEGVPLGRLATKVATLLRGKHRPEFTPHAKVGDFVVVVNAAKVALTGAKATQKKWYRHSGYPGGLKETPYGELRENRPELLVMKAVKGMLPKNRLGRAVVKQLKVYPGMEHPHVAQQPKPTQI